MQIKLPIAPFCLELLREQHYRTFDETFTEPGTISQRTYLFPAPSRAQGELIVAFMRKANIRAIALPLEDETCLTLGKTYTNRGQCAPVIYLTGNLIKYLLELRRQGISDNDILRNYGFVMLKTSGGACRLPAYEEEYRKALKAIGLENFVVELIDIGFTKKPGPPRTGFVTDRPFYMRLFLAIMIGDILNDAERHIRPYEVNAGQTDQVMTRIKQMVGDSYQDKSDRDLAKALKKARRMLESVPVDLAQPRPKVRVIGEFYVASTEGHCTGDMFRWLESQGAEVQVRTVTIYLLHKIWRKIWMAEKLFWAQKKRSAADWKRFLVSAVRWRLLYHSLTRKYRRYTRLLGGYAYPLPSMAAMLKLTRELYHPALFSGEGFMEIAEHIQAVRHDEADMVLSLKPFTCMPSVCSDAVQAKVEQQESGSVFLALEMNGDAMANSRSRILLKLSEAKEKIDAKLQGLCSRMGVSPDQLISRLRHGNLSVKKLRIHPHAQGCTFFTLIKAMDS